MIVPGTQFSLEVITPNNNAYNTDQTTKTEENDPMSIKYFSLAFTSISPTNLSHIQSLKVNSYGLLIIVTMLKKIIKNKTEIIITLKSKDKTFLNINFQILPSDVLSFISTVVVVLSCLQCLRVCLSQLLQSSIDRIMLAVNFPPHLYYS